MTISNDIYKFLKRLKINLFTPAPTLLRRSGYAKVRGE